MRWVAIGFVIVLLTGCAAKYDPETDVQIDAHGLRGLLMVLGSGDIQTIAELEGDVEGGGLGGALKTRSVPRAGGNGDRLAGDQCPVRDAISQCSQRTARLGTSPNGDLAGADVSVRSTTRNDSVVPGTGEHRLVLILPNVP